MTSARVEVRFEGDEPDWQESDLWFGGAAALLALAVGAAVAWRRTGASEFEPARRLPRVLQPALLFSGCVTLWALASEVMAASPSGPLPVVAGIGAIVSAAIALMLFTILDLALGLARPRRTRRWLGLGALAFAGAFVVPIAATMIVNGRPDDIPHPVNLAFYAIGAACGVVWWAYLPPTHPDTVRVFE